MAMETARYANEPWTSDGLRILLDVMDIYGHHDLQCSFDTDLEKDRTYWWTESDVKNAGRMLCDGLHRSDPKREGCALVGSFPSEWQQETIDRTFILTFMDI